MKTTGFVSGAQTIHGKSTLKIVSVVKDRVMFEPVVGEEAWFYVVVVQENEFHNVLRIVFDGKNEYALVDKALVNAMSGEADLVVSDRVLRKRLTIGDRDVLLKVVKNFVRETT